MSWLLCVKFFLLTGCLIIALTLLQDTLFKIEDSKSAGNTNVGTIYSKVIKQREPKVNDRPSTSNKKTVKLNQPQLRLRERF